MVDDKKGSTGGSEAYPVSLKLPQFWPNAVTTWFLQVESQFSINRITNEVTKYNYLVSSLPQDVAESVADVLQKPPQTNLYGNLKDTLIKRHSLSIESRIKRVISDEEIGDSKPSEFYRRLKHLAGTSGTIGEDLVKKLWLSRLPHLISVALIPLQDKDTEFISETADKIWDAMQTSTNKISVVDCDKSSIASKDDISKYKAELSNIKSEISELKEMMKDLSFRETNSRQPFFNRTRSRSRSRDRSRSRSRYNKNGKYCWYHYRFGNKATKCEANCKFVSGNSRESNQQSSTN